MTSFDVAFDLVEMDRLAGHLDTASGLLAETSLALGAELRAAGLPTSAAARLAEVSSWSHDAAGDIRRRAALARAAQVPVSPMAPAAKSEQGSGGGGVGGWLSDRADDLGDAVDTVTGAASDLAGGVADTTQDLLDAAGGWASDAWEAGGRAVDQATDRAGEVFDDVVHWATRTAGDVIDWADGALDDAGGWVDEHLAGVRDWIGEHADVLRIAGGVMSTAGKVLVGVGAAVATVSAAVGLFTGVGFLGEIPAGAILAVGFVLWGGGEALGTAADWGEGKIDGRGLLTGVLVDVVSGFAVGKVVKVVGKVLEPFLPRIKQWVDDLLPGRRDAGPAPDLPPIPDPPRAPDLPPAVGGGEPLPGLGRPLRGGTPDAPVPYGYANPADHLRDAVRPLQDDVDDLGRHRDYAPGTREHMDTAWRDYLLRKRMAGQPPQSWERWRATYVRNQGQAAQGRAYEEAFRKAQGFDAADGWLWPEGGVVPSVTTPSGGRRDFDILNPDAKIAYELKSGNRVDPGQLAKDRELVDDDWELVYVFGKEPSAATRRKLEEAGIRIEVWLGSPTVTR